MVTRTYYSNRSTNKHIRNIQIAIQSNVEGPYGPALNLPNIAITFRPGSIYQTMFRVPVDLRSIYQTYIIEFKSLCVSVKSNGPKLKHAEVTGIKYYFHVDSNVTPIARDRRQTAIAHLPSEPSVPNAINPSRRALRLTVRLMRFLYLVGYIPCAAPCSVTRNMVQLLPLIEISYCELIGTINSTIVVTFIERFVHSFILSSGFMNPCSYFQWHA